MTATSKTKHCEFASFSVLVVVGSLVLIFVVVDKVAGQEGRSYLIPGRVILGLSGQSNTTSFPDGRQWIPDVDEAEWQYIIVHHTATESGSVESIHQEHVKRKDSDGNPWLGIGYHFVIGNGNGMSDGSVQATFRWKEQLHGAHAGNALINARGIGICVIGNFENDGPTRAQLESLKTLVRFLALRHRIAPDNFMGHTAVKATVCPGKHFPLNEIRQVISKTVN